MDYVLPKVFLLGSLIWSLTKRTRLSYKHLRQDSIYPYLYHFRSILSEVFSIAPNSNVLFRNFRTFLSNLSLRYSITNSDIKILIWVITVNTAPINVKIENVSLEEDPLTTKEVFHYTDSYSESVVLKIIHLNMTFRETASAIINPAKEA